MAHGRHIAYFRVSTKRQGESGLGLEAQRTAVIGYLNGGSWQLVAEVVEVESGKRNDRPKLAEALRLCKIHKATLIIAKLDRLARNVAFVSALMESGVEFVAVDFPQGNRLTIHIMAAVAEHEAEMISARTKAALAAAKAKGTKIGRRPGEGGVLTESHRAKATQAIKGQADERAALLVGTIGEIQAEGKTSLHQIAAALNARGITTAKGGKWQAVQVQRVMRRQEA